MRRHLFPALAAIAALSLPVRAEATYVGVGACARCHDTAAPGDVLHQWRASKHAAAYRSLVAHSETEARKCQGLELWIVEIGRGVKYGLPRPAAESKECLPCHTTAFGADPRLLAASFDRKDGVQCESCHGPGSDHAEAAAAGGGGEIAACLRRFGDERAIKALCRSCHEGTCGDFDFEKMWPEVSHSRQAGP